MHPDVGRVAALTRYPVKSMAGQHLSSADLGPRGLEGDRTWAVCTEDGGIGSGKTTRRFRRVDGRLGLSAVLDGAVLDGAAPVVTVPDGSSAVAGTPEADALVSVALGRPLRLAAETEVPHHDEAPVHVVTTAALGRVADLLGAAEVDATRFRANVVLELPGTGFPEDDWHGRRLALGGEVVLRLGAAMPRCVMVDLAPGGGRRTDRVLRLLGEHHGADFGLQATVERGGTVRTGDRARLL